MREPGWAPDEIEINGRAYVAKDTIAERASAGPLPPEPVFTAAQVAEMSNTSARTVYSLMDRGVIAYIVPNGCERPRLVTQSEYERWVGLRERAQRA